MRNETSKPWVMMSPWEVGPDSLRRLRAAAALPARIYGEPDALEILDWSGAICARPKSPS